MDIASFLHRQSRSAEPIEAAVADNCRFDERTSAQRWQTFEDVLARVAVDPDSPDWADWGEAATLHLEQRSLVPTASVPDLFLQINRGAWLDGLDATTGNQTLVRFESLSWPLSAQSLTLEQLEGMLNRADSGRDDDAQQAAEGFFAAWNQARDGRPTFGAFYDEVKDEADADDWPHALRDRLGLGHYGSSRGARLPVALMRYRLSEVIAAKTQRSLPVACALPTVLDGGMHEFFFPVPR